jgi:2,4-dienoyl-CoA reductase (NADPH2)
MMSVELNQHTVMTPYMVGAVHYYTCELPDGSALFDTGPPTEEARVLVTETVDLSRLGSIFITHCHADHYGLAEFLRSHSDAVLYLPRKDVIKFQRHDERMERMAELLGSYGFTAEFITQLRASFDRNRLFAATPTQFRIVEESPELVGKGVQWLACPGHSQSDLVYLVDNCAVTGDLLLKDIFQAPLLDVDYSNFRERFRNYDAYCASLEHLTLLRGREIKPGHRERVEGVNQSIIFYVTTLINRSGKLRQLRNKALPDLVEHLFSGRQVDPLLLYLKASEVIFMWDFLDDPELLKRALQRIGLYTGLAELFDQADHLP